MEQRFESDGLLLAGHIARPDRRGGGPLPGLLLCHGYPSGAGGSATSARTYPELADRIATALDWAVLAFTFRGCGASEGNFSLGGWMRDITAAAGYLSAEEPLSGLWAAGFGTGGALCICAAARDPRFEGVAALGAPADFDDWASHPRRLLDHSRAIKVIRDAQFPPSLDAWVREIRDLRPAACAQELAPRPLLVVHGTEDEVVPDFDARVLGDAHGQAELRLISAAGHRLRHDPRAVAVLLGWLDRQKHRVRAPQT